MIFNPLTISDISLIQSKLQTENLFGSDCSLGTMFLLQNRYNSSFCITKDFLFRRYESESENLSGYLFPIKLSDDSDFKNAINSIYQDSVENNRDFKFCLCTSEQKNLINDAVNSLNLNVSLNWQSDSGDFDYLYLQEKLASLAGSKLQKKRNHVNQFKKIYENQWKFEFITSDNFSKSCEDAVLEVLNKWHKEKGEWNKDFEMEEESIKSALENFKDLNLIGGILYVSGFPIAFCIASKVSNVTLDIHFEKAIDLYARNGAFALINQEFVKNCPEFRIINREEDLNIEGLRKAKLSYKPELILEKFYSKL